MPDTFAFLFVKYPFIGVLLSLIMLDIISGLLAAASTGEVSSATSFRGMCGKVMIVGMVGTGFLFQLIVPNVQWGSFIAIFFIVTEAISITENSSKLGLPIPDAWTRALQAMKQKESDKVEAQHPPVKIEVHAHEANLQDSQISRMVVEKDVTKPDSTK